MFKGQGAIARLDQALEINPPHRVAIEDNLSSGDRIVLLPVNPNKFFTYWDFDKKTFEKLRSFNGIIANLGLFSDNYEVETEIRFNPADEHSMNYYFDRIKTGEKYQSALFIPKIELYLKSNIVSLKKPEEPVYNLDKRFTL